MQEYHHRVAEPSYATTVTHSEAVKSVEAFAIKILSAIAERPLLVFAEPAIMPANAEWRVQSYEFGTVSFQICLHADFLRRYTEGYYSTIERVCQALSSEQDCWSLEPEDIAGEQGFLLNVYAYEEELVQFTTLYARIDGSLEQEVESRSLNRYLAQCQRKNESLVDLFVRCNETSSRMLNPKLEIHTRDGRLFKSSLLVEREEIVMEITDAPHAEEVESGLLPLQVHLGTLDIEAKDLMALRSGTRIALDTSMPLKGCITINNEYQLAEVEIAIEDDMPVLTVTRLSVVEDKKSRV